MFTVTADLLPVFSGLKEDVPENTFMPNERVTLDDCYLRSYKHGGKALVKPAFANPAFLTEFAHIGAIGWTREDGSINWACGGSLIWNNYIITAAHCTVNEQLSRVVRSSRLNSVLNAFLYFSSNVAPDVVRFGDLNIHSDHDDAHAQQLSIVKIIRHPQYAFSAKYYDIALMQLERNITVHETVVPACLWFDQEVRFKELEAAGWGQTGFAEAQTPILLKITLKPLSNEDCSKHYTSKTVRGLRKGLDDHQICAGDEKMDTCVVSMAWLKAPQDALRSSHLQGDSGGPLHVRLMHNARVTPFLVGVTSFGHACGQSHPGVYTRIASFRSWIVETLQTNGAPEVADSMFEPAECVLRHVGIRQLAISTVVANESGVFETIDTKLQFLSSEFVEEVVQLKWSESVSAAKNNCMGSIIDINAVITLGDCTSHEGAQPTQILHRVAMPFKANAYIEQVYNVMAIHLHPNYTRNSSYNNIAVLTINGSFNVIPPCMWNAPRVPHPQMELAAVGRTDLNIPQHKHRTKYDSSVMRLNPRVFEYDNGNCSLAKEYSGRFDHGLQDEHLCFGNVPFLVPQVCELASGAPLQRWVYRSARFYKHLYGISLVGRDCGYGEPAVAVRLYPFVGWLESLLLPNRSNVQHSQPADAVQFINPDLELFDRCDFHDDSAGLCVPTERCRGVKNRLDRRDPMIFCTNVTIVCCLPKHIMDDEQLVNDEVQQLEECENRYESFRKPIVETDSTEMLDPKPHLVKVISTSRTNGEQHTLCLGYLITTGTIITSAACTLIENHKPDQVILGSIQNLDDQAAVQKPIESIIRHPEYYSDTGANDLALLKLFVPIQPTAAIFPACLWRNETHTPLVATLLSVAGSELTEQIVHPMYVSDCERSVKAPLGIGDLCMVSAQETSTFCPNTADPITWRGKGGDRAPIEFLVGMFSHSSCKSDEPYVNARIPAYYNWIVDNFPVIMMCRSTLLVALAVAVLPYGSAKLYPASPRLPADEADMMMPFDRTSLDDCHMRHWKDGFEGLVAPAYGNPAYLREFAHIAAIGWTGSDGKVNWACGGSLIWENFILTAAHCAANDDDIAPDVARMGDLNIYSDEDDEHPQQLRIVKVIRHKQHRFSAKYYDVALMQLERNITVHETVAPACLWLDDEVRFPKLYAAGWGRTGFGEDKTRILLKVDLTPMSNAECSRFYNSAERGLRNGLHAHHLCAGDEKMDTCPGDSGGPLHVKLLHNAKMTPFLVGVTSFGKPCGQANPGVYARVSRFVDWIIETLQQEGELATAEKFTPWSCALRYVHVREYEDDVVVSRSNNYESYNSDNAHLVSGDSRHRVTIQWPNTLLPLRENCSGTVIERDAVATLAECASHMGRSPSRVRFSNGRMVNVSETVVHPNYNPSVGRYYNNIAILKLEYPVAYIPACVWYNDSLPDPQFEVLGSGRADLTPYNRDERVTGLDGTIISISPRATHTSNRECKLADQYRSLLGRGLQREHICFQNKPFLVPATCAQHSGGPIERELWRFSKYFNYVYGMNLFGRDCGFGEPAVAVSLNAHRAWLESVLLPEVASQRDPVIFINPDLQLNDRCSYGGGVAGVCVAHENCPNIRQRMASNQPVTLCSKGSVVCCPRQDIKAPPTAIEKEFNECEQRYRSLRKQRQQRWDGFQPLNRRLSHVAEVGWEDGSQITFQCFGYLISTSAVVAAASCVLDNEYQPSIVRVGALWSNQAPTDIAIATISLMEIHPQFNRSSYENNIAVLKLTTPIQPTVTAFPGCLWQNQTHNPVEAAVFSPAGHFHPIHPMYLRDCNFRFAQPFRNPRITCMVPGVTGTSEYCYPAGAPIIYRKHEEKNLFTEYLVNMYSHGRCNSTNLRIVTRMAMYIDWFKEVLK
uniref:Peptidase S1 domain-containing protein n=1 Tax=Anopheles dirus TaxID=7168 RepID=A0A182MYB5_9DIPT